MRFKRVAPLLVVLMLSILVLAACSGNEGENNNTNSNSGEEKKTVKFMHLWPEGSSAKHHEIINDIVNDFEEENSNIKIDLDVLSNEQYKDKMKVLATSDDLPDIGMTWAAGYMEPFIDGDMYAELDDAINEEDFVAGTLDGFSEDDKTYGMPLELNISTIFYNKEIFAEHNLDEPETLDDLNDIVSTLNENNVEPIALGNKDAWTGSMWYMYLADRLSDDEDILTEAVERETSFEEPALIEAAEEIQSLVDADSFVAGTNGLSDEEAKSMFMEGQAAMYLIATWDLPNFTTNEDIPQEFRDNVGYFEFPTVDGKGNIKNYVGGPGVGLFVSEKSDVVDEAKTFISYFQEQWGERAVTDVGIIPATKVDGESLDLPDMYVDVLNDLNGADNITLYLDVQMNPSTAEKHLDLIQALFGGEITPEEFAEEHEEALSKDE